MSEQNTKLPYCVKCGREMEIRSASFVYLKRGFSHPLPVCPICGQVFIPEELVTEKMRAIEAQLEAK